MKKILYVTTIAGFLPQFERNDVRIVKDMGYEVHYASNFDNPVYSYDEDVLKEDGIITHQIDIAKSPARIFKGIKSISQLKRIIVEENINLIHCHNPMGAVNARIAARLSGRKPVVIYTAHGFHFYKGAPLINWIAYYPVEKFLAHYTDIIVTINREDYSRAKDKFHLKKGGFISQIHGVGVDVNRFCENRAINEAKRKELDVPRKAFHIVTAAELNANKNQRVVIEALAKLNRKDIYYSMCGKGPNDEKLQELIEKYNLQDRVRMIGFRTDMEEILQTADLFAFPSRREGLGIAAVEALLCGVPVLASDNRGTREYVRNGINGMVANSDNAGDFAEAIARFADDAEYRQHISEQCRQTAIIFGTDETMRIMKEVYLKADSKIS